MNRWRFAALLLTVACARGVIGALPPVADPRAAADVWVIRRYDYVGSANSYELTVDGSRIFGIRNSQHTAFLLAPGDHELGVRCFGGWFPIWHEAKLRVSLRQGQKHSISSSRRLKLTSRPPDLSAAPASR